MSRPLSLAHLTVIDLAPPKMIEVAARCGYDYVGLRLIKVTPTSPGYPIMDDPVMMRETKAALADHPVGVWDIEFVKVSPETDVAALEPVLAAGAELGAKNLICAPYQPDLDILSDQLAAISALSQKYGISTVLEFFPWTNVPDLNTALDVVENAGPQVKILVDTLHFNRSNSSLELLETVDPKRLPFLHLCDAPVRDKYSTDDLLFAGREERLAPGEGDINLKDIIARMPENIPIALEVPMTQLMRAEGSEAVALKNITAARNLLSER
jgi:sugar phosphate isomerase/epimerase